MEARAKQPMTPRAVRNQPSWSPSKGGSVRKGGRPPGAVAMWARTSGPGAACVSGGGPARSGCGRTAGPAWRTPAGASPAGRTSSSSTAGRCGSGRVGVPGGGRGARIRSDTAPGRSQPDYPGRIRGQGSYLARRRPTREGVGSRTCSPDRARTCTQGGSRPPTRPPGCRPGARGRGPAVLRRASIGSSPSANPDAGSPRRASIH